MASTLPHDNAVRWTREQFDGHVESYFVKATSPDGKRALWLKHTLLVEPGPEQNGIAETWFVAFERGKPARGAKAKLPIAHGSYRSHPFLIVLGESSFDSKSAKGRLSSSDGDIRWDFTLASRMRAYRTFPFDWMYTRQFPRTKTTTPAPSAVLAGSLVVHGETWTLDGWSAMQGHNWGTSHSHRWTWAQCSDFPGAKGAWFEAVSARMRAAGVSSPWLSIGALHVDGRTHRFDSPTSWIATRTCTGLFFYEVAFESAEAVVSARVEAARDEVVCLRYENPDESTRSCLNSKLARIVLDVNVRGGASHRLESDRCALEIGVPEGEHDLPTLL